MSNALLEKLEESLSDTSDVYIAPGIAADSFVTGLVEDLRGSTCEPFAVTATVMPPGFADKAIGDAISAMCIAHRDGYWLAYQPEIDRFYCFWGTDVGSLGAHGVTGSPLYCWSA